jgi:hypothetical protein
MNPQFRIILIMLFMITTILLSNNIAEASPLDDSSSLSPLLLDGIISSLILDIPPFDIPLLTGNQSNDLEPFNITSVGKFILAGDWNMTFDNIGSSIDDIDTALEVQGFEADFMAVFEDGTGPHTHQISNFNPVSMDASEVHAGEDTTVLFILIY